MEKTFENLSRFEYELLWMACRYAIGRHTIASCMLPEDIIKNMYGRLSDDQMEQECKDIRYELYSHLKAWYNFELYNESRLLHDHDPLALFMECLNNDNLTNFDNVECLGYDENDKPYVTMVKEGQQSRSLHYLSDLASWASLANLFNKKSWLKLTVKCNGKKTVVPVYCAWLENYGGDLPVRMVYKSLDDVAKVNEYINEDMITKIEPYEV